MGQGRRPTCGPAGTGQAGGETALTSHSGECRVSHGGSKDSCHRAQQCPRCRPLTATYREHCCLPLTEGRPGAERPAEKICIRSLAQGLAWLRVYRRRLALGEGVNIKK